jgi:transketolase
MIKINNSILKIKKISEELKKKIIEISFKKKTHHIGSCLSCIDILTALYFGFMKIDKTKISSNDKFIMSKGHAALTYYLMLMKKNFFTERFLLKEYMTNNGKLGGHPDTNLTLGIDFCTGSLGNGLSVASGMAYTYKKDKKNNKVFVLIGDGECNEGIIWESLLFAAQHKLNNLYVVLDYNKLQGFGATKHIINLDPIKSKFKSFNWNVLETDGHNIKLLIETLKKFNNNKSRPNLIIAHTVKGKYVKFMENKFESHYQVLSENDYQISLKGLEC